MLRDKIVAYMVEADIIKENERKVYCFGLQLIEEMLFSFCVFLLIGILFGNVAETIVFFGAFAVLRQYAGGFHAKKFISCLAISCCIITTLNLLLIFFTDFTWAIIPCAAVGLPAIFVLSPVDSVYKYINKNEVKKYRKCSTVILLIEFVIMLLLVLTSKYSMAFCISYAWLVLSALLVLGRYKNRAGTRE